MGLPPVPLLPPIVPVLFTRCVVSAMPDLLRRFRRFRRRQKQASPAMSARPPSALPMPMPAFAPLESPELAALDDEGVDVDAEAVPVCNLAVGEEDAVAEVVPLNVETVGRTV